VKDEKIGKRKGPKLDGIAMDSDVFITADNSMTSSKKERRE